MNLDKILQETDEFAKKRDAAELVSELQTNDSGTLWYLFKEDKDFYAAAKNFDSPSIIRELVERIQSLEKVAFQAQEMAKEQFERVNQLAQGCTGLLLLIEHETNLPASAQNGVTDPTGSIDEGVVRASRIISEAQEAMIKCGINLDQIYGVNKS